jgi:hypothetical protein
MDVEPEIEEDEWMPMVGVPRWGAARDHLKHLNSIVAKNPTVEPSRPPGPLKLGPNFRAPTRPSWSIVRVIPYHFNIHNFGSSADQDKWFRFGSRVLHATAASVDDVHRNVLRLEVQPSFAQRLVQSLVGLLPSSVRTFVESRFPEWTLPTRLILKRQKESWDDEFEMEKDIYAKLRPLQGTVIPRYFGELRYENKRAILLSDIGGAALATPEGLLLEMADFRRMMHQAMSAVAQFGMFHDDIKLDNYHITGDKIMVVDLERMNEGLTDKEYLDQLVKGAVDRLANRYEHTQYCLWKDGLIAIDQQPAVVEHSAVRPRAAHGGLHQSQRLDLLRA